MSLVREVDRGKIKISNRFISELIKEAMNEGVCFERVWPGGPKGKKTDALNFFIDDFHNEVFVTDDEFGNISLRFPVTIKFGSSISLVTQALSENVKTKIEKALDQPVKKITIEVRGIKYKNLSRREVEVVKEYEFD